MSDSDPSVESGRSDAATGDDVSLEEPSSEGSSADEEIQEEDVPDDPTESDGGDSDEASDALSPFLENVRAPIDEDAPAGESILYDEDFRTLKAHIDKIGSASGDADYEEIVDLARSLLTEKAKDLRAGAYLVIGEARLNGSSGAAEAVHAVRFLIDKFWEDLFPEKSRMKGRGSALQFIADRLPDWLEAASFDRKDRQHLVKVLEHLEAIQEFSLEEMGEHAPSLSGLVSDLDGEISALPEPKPDPDPDLESEGDSNTDRSSEGEPPETTETTSPERGPDDGGGPIEVASETDALQSVRTVAEYYREKDGSNPISYRLLRTIRWGTLRSEPSNDGGSTRFEAPREHRRTYLEGLLKDDEYETLIREGESSFQSGTFHVWLDLQRLVAAAMDAIGEPYRDAREAVLFELTQLVRRIPGLLSLTYRDGTPFARPLTVDWIESEVLPQFQDEGGRATEAGAVNGLGAVMEDYEAARSELRGGNLGEALSLMNEGATADGSKKEEFHRQLYVASLCVKGGQPRIARPLLDELDIAIDTHNLDGWDPGLALEVWTTRCQCYDLLAKEAGPDASKQLQSEAEATFEKICRTDPEQAVSVDSQRPV